MRRREFVGLIGSAAAWPLVAETQYAGRIPVVGVLWHAATEAEEEPMFGWIREGFTRLGYVTGRSVLFEDRYPAEIPERFDAMAVELVQLNVNVIIAVGPAAGRAARKATSQLPIVVVNADPIALGFVASLARPGGNITGVSLLNLELDSKRLQIFKEALPKLARLALISNPDQKEFREINLRHYADAGR